MIQVVKTYCDWFFIITTYQCITVRPLLDNTFWIGSVFGFTPLVIPSPQYHCLHHRRCSRYLNYPTSYDRVGTAARDCLVVKSLPSTNTETTLATANSGDSSVNEKGSSNMRFISGLQEIVNDYDVFLIDMWGVLHDGIQPYEHVLHAIQQLKATNHKTLLLLSNSSKRYQHSIRNLQQLGFNVHDFHTVITSGEVTFQLLSNTSTTPLTWEPLQAMMMTTPTTSTASTRRNIFVFGSGDDDIPYCTSCGWTPVSDIVNADLLLARGPFTIPDSTCTNTESSSDSDGSGSKYHVIDRRIQGEDMYQQALQTVLQIATKQGIPMLISNPDKVRPDADRSPMPGQIGDLYESIIIRQNTPEQVTNDDSGKHSSNSTTTTVIGETHW
jgi:ribonucleotide monophosphatase NagD (HAD superfamily)